MIVNIFLETTIFTWFTQIQTVSLFTSLFHMSQPFVLEAYFDGAGGSISNWRSLLSEIVLTPRFLNDILENFPVHLQNRWDWEKMCLSTGLYYYFSFCQVVHWCIYFPFLAIQYPNTRLLADELLAFSASSSRARTRMSQLPTLWRSTLQLFSVRGIISGNHLKGSNWVQVKERASHPIVFESII